MTEPTPIDLPVGLRWVKLVCRLGTLVTDSAADADAHPDLLPVGGTLTLAASPSRVRIQEDDGRWRSVEVAGRTYTIRADGELVDNEGRVGVWIPDPASLLVEPQGYAITAVVKPTGGTEWRVTVGGGTVLPDVVDLVAVSSVGPVAPSVTASVDARLYALETGGGVDVSQIVEDYLVANPPAAVADATTTTKGILRLAGDLGGTATAPTVPGLAGKADTGHDHAIGDVTGLQSALDGKQAAGSYAAATHDHTAGDIDSGAATDGHVLTADGAGGAAWEAPPAGGGGSGSGIELVSGTVTLDSSGAPIREFYATGSATINGVTFPAGTAVVWRRTIDGQWGYIVVDGWTDTGGDPDPELITVTATAPTWTDDAINGGGTWTTPTITGVAYSPASGTATPGQSVTVSATAQTGYQLAGTSSWTHSFPAAPSSGPAIVQTKIIQDTSVTLDAAPTPGNLLVVGVGSNADPANFAFSHGLTLDGTAGPNGGWHVGMASAIVQSGATATVTVTGMGTNPRLTVWELADVAGFVDSDTDQSADGYGKSLTFTTGGDFTLIHIHTDGAPGVTTTTGGIVMDSTAADSRGLSAHAHPATTGGTITWTSGRRAVGIAGGYA